jgi:hypothetical protein
MAPGRVVVRARWRTIAFLAVALVSATVAAVAGTAVALGLVVARAACWLTARVTDTTGRSALTLVRP